MAAKQETEGQIIERARVQMERTQMRDWLMGRLEQVTDYFTALTENDHDLLSNGFKKNEYPHNRLTTLIYNTEFSNEEAANGSRLPAPEELQAEIAINGFDLNNELQLRFRLSKLANGKINSIYVTVAQGARLFEIGNLELRHILDWPDRQAANDSKLAQAIRQLQLFEQTQSLVSNIVAARERERDLGDRP